MANPRPWYGEFLVAGTSAVGAICFTNPIDVVKTRMTLQGEGGSASQFGNPASALLRIGRTEGIAGLQRGLGPSCLWQFSNVSVRFGVYSSAKRLTGVEDQTPFRKWLSSLGLAAISGGLAALASNPFFILKVRPSISQHLVPAGSDTASLPSLKQRACLTSLRPRDSQTRFQSGGQHALTGGVGGAVLGIWQSDGVPGFFRGLSAFAPRVIVASAVQLSTYDVVKEWLVSRFGVPHGLPLVVGSSFVTGLAVVGAMQPFDFAATRLVNSRTAAERAAAPVGGTEAALAARRGSVAAAAATPSVSYTGPLDVIRQTVKAEGIRGVYRGAVANYLRFGPYCVLVFVFVEKGRLMAFQLADYRSGKLSPPPRGPSQPA